MGLQMLSEICTLGVVSTERSMSVDSKQKRLQEVWRRGPTASVSEELRGSPIEGSKTRMLVWLRPNRPALRLGGEG